jgi:hypothetical protein
MRITRFLVLCLLFLGFSNKGITQDSFIADSAFQYIEVLCKPSFDGRKTGLPGARLAAEWIGSKLKNWGLLPGGDSNSYLQTFPMIVTSQTHKAKFRLLNGLFGSINYQEGNDFIVYFNSGSGRLKAEVVFAGFGISEPEKGWDDYKGIDVQDKIVMVFRGRPQDQQDCSEVAHRINKTGQRKMNVIIRHH